MRKLQEELARLIEALETAEESAASLEILIADHGEMSEPTVDGFEWGARSKKRMKGVHPDLIKVMDRAIELTPIDLTVLEGLRTKKRQRQLVASGASKTMNSRHLTGHAIDIAPLDAKGKVSWDWPLYHKIAIAIKQAADDVGVTVEWGGDWKSFKDGPHWQLPWSEYPA